MRTRVIVAALTGFWGATACGYSAEEYEQQVRANESLRAQLAQRDQALQKCESDYADAVAEIDALEGRLRESGVSLESVTQDLERQRQALEEYQRRAEQLEEIRARLALLREKLRELTSLGLQVAVRDNRMVIQLPGDVLFASGRADLTTEGEDILLRVAAIIRDDEDLSHREFQVAGHTDAKPLQGGPFRDNWGLSAMRARSVVAFLTAPAADDGGGLTPGNWSAAGYAETDPLGNNDTEEGRGRNRRVELVVLPNVEEMLNLNSLVSE
jgi:chemotaxis protein MotB